MTDTIIHLLDYTDDVVILEDDTPRGVQKIIKRVKSISQDSKTDADILLNADKMEVIHIRNQEELSPMTREEAKGVCTPG